MIGYFIVLILLLAYILVNHVPVREELICSKAKNLCTMYVFYLSKRKRSKNIANFNIVEGAGSIMETVRGRRGYAREVYSMSLNLANGRKIPTFRHNRPSSPYSCQEDADYFNSQFESGSELISISHNLFFTWLMRALLFAFISIFVASINVGAEFRCDKSTDTCVNYAVSTISVRLENEKFSYNNISTIELKALGEAAYNVILTLKDGKKYILFNVYTQDNAQLVKDINFLNEEIANGAEKINFKCNFIAKSYEIE